MSLPDFLAQTLQNPVLCWFFRVPLVLILLDVLTGIIAAVCTKTFQWQRLASFLGNDLLKYLLTTLAVLLCYLAGGIVQATTLASTLGMGVLAIHVIGSIRANILEIVKTSSLAPLAPIIDDATEPALQALTTQVNQPLPIEFQPTKLTPAIQLPKTVGVTLQEAKLNRTTPGPTTSSLLFPKNL